MCDRDRDVVHSRRVCVCVVWCASIGRLSGIGALWDCVPRVYGGGGGCASGGVPLGAVPALSCCGEVSLGCILIIIVRPNRISS